MPPKSRISIVKWSATRSYHQELQVCLHPQKTGLFRWGKTFEPTIDFHGNVGMSWGVKFLIIFFLGWVGGPLQRVVLHHGVNPFRKRWILRDVVYLTFISNHFVRTTPFRLSTISYPAVHPFTKQGISATFFLRSAPTSYKWSYKLYSPYKWPYKGATRVLTPIKWSLLHPINSCYFCGPTLQDWTELHQRFVSDFEGRLEVRSCGGRYLLCGL